MAVEKLFFSAFPTTKFEALSVDRDIGAKADAALGQVALAEVVLAQGGPLDQGTLRSAVDELRLQKITDEPWQACNVACSR